MLAVIAAILFGLALVFDVADIASAPVFTPMTFIEAGLALAALHLAGFDPRGGPGRRWRRR